MKENKHSVIMEVQGFHRIKITKLKFMKLKLIGNYAHQYIIIFQGYLQRGHKDIKKACFILSYHLTISG